jgi:hypothetical protein
MPRIKHVKATVPVGRDCSLPIEQREAYTSPR